jgi:hypothetical protein
MIINIDSGRSLRRREVLLQTLTKAVCLQIELWDAIADLQELVETDFDPLVWIQSTSIVVDAGTDLTLSDVDDYLSDIQRSRSC